MLRGLPPLPNAGILSIVGILVSITTGVHLFLTKNCTITSPKSMLE